MDNQQINVQKVIEKLSKKLGDAHCQISVNEIQIEQLQEIINSKNEEVESLKEQLTKYENPNAPEVIESK